MSATELTVPWWSVAQDRWLAVRNRLLASPVFRRRAAAFPLTRPTARRHARHLFDLVAGFVYSQILAACVELDLFEILAQGPQEPVALARRLNLPAESTARLLDAAVSLRLLQRQRNGRYALAKLGAAMVGNTAVIEMIKHHPALYADLADPVALLRSGGGQGELARYWPYARNGLPGGQAQVGEQVEHFGAAAAEVGNERNLAGASASVHSGDSLLRNATATYTALMAASQPLVTEEILDAYSFAGHRCLLDVGGGDGTFLVAAGRRHPGLALRLFDLPAVAAIATDKFEATGMAERARAVGGSFLTDRLPEGADIATLVRVIHDHDDASAMTILRAVRAALPAHGRLLLAEPMAGTPGSEPMGDAYFGFYLLAMGRGRPRSQDQLVSMLEAAGFEQVRSIPTRMPLQTRLLLAHVKH